MKLRKLKYPKLARELTKASDFKRELALYESQPVLFDWESVQKGPESQIKRSIEGLALLLRNIADSAFHSLRCVGFLQHDNSKYYAFGFNVPLPEPEQALPSVSDVSSLTLTLVPPQTGTESE